MPDPNNETGMDRRLVVCIKESKPHIRGPLCVNWLYVDQLGLNPPIQEPPKAKPLHAVGVSVLLIEQGKLLLGKRGPATGAAQGLYSTPGGRLEIKESFEECAKREFKEETGASLYGDLKVIGFRKHFRFDQDYIMFYVFAHDHVGMIANPEGLGKCEGWQWIDAADLIFFGPPVTEPKDILFEAFAEAERRQL